MQPWQMTPDEFVAEYGTGFPGAEALKKLGGLAAFAGVDPEALVMARRVTDHPMLTRRTMAYVWFPGEEPRHLVEGKVVRVLTHPRGLLLFDFEIDRPPFYETVRLWPRELHAGIVALALKRGRKVPLKARRGYKERLGKWMPLRPEAV